MRSIRSWLPVLACATLCAGLALPQHALAQTKFTVGYTAAGDFLPAFVAKEKGFFDKRKLDVTFTRIGLASTIPAALVSNSVQIGTGTGPGLLQAVEGGLDLVAVSGAARQRRDNPTVSLVVRKGITVAAPADLKGKKIGVPGLNSVIDVLVRKWLVDRGVPVAQVTIVEAPFPQMSDLLRGGTLDAVAVLEPFRSKILNEGTGTKVSDFVGEIKDNLLWGFWIATRSWTAANPEAARGFREACAEGEGFIKQNPDEAKAIEAKYLGVAVPGFSSFETEIKPADLDDYVKIGRELGFLRENVDTARLIFK
jgi:NitT/TauT family transport system substrate-binding protein